MDYGRLITKVIIIWEMSKPPKERRNWLIYTLYTRGEHDECLRVIEETLAETNQRSELACFIKGLILRSRGNIQGSLEQFRMVASLDPKSLDCLKQLGRSLFLTGKHRSAIDTYERALGISPEDWEVWHNKGLCHLNRIELEESSDCFRSANLI
jgi:Bardet-Biedl syndrome 4 protein